MNVQLPGGSSKLLTTAGKLNADKYGIRINIEALAGSVTLIADVRKIDIFITKYYFNNILLNAFNEIVTAVFSNKS